MQILLGFIDLTIIEVLVGGAAYQVYKIFTEK